MTIRCRIYLITPLLRYDLTVGLSEHVRQQELAPA